MNMTSKKCNWKKHINAWENSGVSQAEYCRKNGISVKTFGYHKRRMAAAAIPPYFARHL
ncbi:IS66 family insertion sequence element accessory protein TnpA [Maridesulfovibrio hydrothermalis]|uniref:IS66 family insertion sequence element accessory protein TnpA n=1 Tax=Maridesulfovibrio hydrothermalis TaxID=191026 RepID=UPI00403AD5F2